MQYWTAGTSPSKFSPHSRNGNTSSPRECRSPCSGVRRSWSRRSTALSRSKPPSLHHATVGLCERARTTIASSSIPSDRHCSRKRRVSWRSLPSILTAYPWSRASRDEWITACHAQSGDRCEEPLPVPPAVAPPVGRWRAGGGLRSRGRPGAATGESRLAPKKPGQCILLSLREFRGRLHEDADVLVNLRPCKVTASVRDPLSGGRALRVAPGGLGCVAELRSGSEDGHGNGHPSEAYASSRRLFECGAVTTAPSRGTAPVVP